ncbi:hypothetical protein AB0I37_24830 [Micromonospora purpureochromogenes]|uniref:hypothetical protein n=1 Tax=Micromonospora purpureochromogenes TaxID=47872 RepID=UPI003403C457
MNRAAVIQMALVSVLIGVMLILLGGGGAQRREHPKQPTTYRPATEAERRQAEVDRLREEMDRLWEQHQQEDAAR